MTRLTMLTTARLKFETWDEDDLRDLFELQTDPLVRASYRPDPAKWTEAAIRTRLRGYVAEQAALGCTKWKLSLRDGTFIGRAGWSPWGDHTLEIGYAIKPAFWKQGYGSEAAGALTDWALANRHDDRLVGFALTYNIASRSILGGIGMSFVDYRDIDGVENAFYEL